MGYSSLDFNPRPVDPDRPGSRGRFSSTISNPYAYMYVAEGRAALRAALWETLDFYDVSSDSHGYLLPSRIFRDLAALEMRLTQRLYVVNIRDQEDAMHFRADIRALQGDDSHVTRAWAHYIRRVMPRTQGLRYESRRLGGARNGEYALVLFEELPHTTDTNSPPRQRKVVGKGSPLELLTPTGKRKVRDALSPLQIRFQ